MSDKKKQQSLPSGPETVMDIFRRSLQYRASWPDKEDYLDVIYWQRQVVGLVLGLIFGILGFTGIFAIAAFFVINTAAVYLYSSMYQQVDDDEFGGTTEILKEGLMTSFSTFLVAWIALYSGLHHN